jgi:hypothetical protein
MLNQVSERTFVSCIAPQDAANVNTCLGHSFEDPQDLLDVAGMFFSLPVDFRVKTTGMGHANTTLVNQLPILDRASPMRERLHNRVLVLSAVTRAFEELWRSVWNGRMTSDEWTKSDPRLAESCFRDQRQEWSWAAPLRTSFARRQALVEIDVLASMSLHLTLGELLTMYRIQFPVLQQNERDTWYDQSGRIVFTANKGLSGVGFDRPQWNEIKDMRSGAVTRTIIDGTLPGGPRERTITYVAPFDRCDRETDYRQAWSAFVERGALKKGEAPEAGR